MDSSYEATDSLTVVEVKSRDDDRWFLLHFIMGTYFGPDIKGEWPQKSVLQRMAEGLPPYTPDQLAGSHMKMVDLHRVYSYLLRKADDSLVVKEPFLRRFFRGDLEQDATCFYAQFTDLFPLDLHSHSRLKNQYKIVENIVFINNPEMFYIKREDVERFKRLTGMERFLLDEVDLGFSTNKGAVRSDRSEVGGALHNVVLQEQESKSSFRNRRVTEVLDSEDPLQVMIPVSTSMPFNGTPMAYSDMTPSPSVDCGTGGNSGPTVIYLPSRPSVEEQNNILAATKTGFALTGSAALGPVRPLVGLMDMGECEDRYFFRVSLPGVKRDETEFSCEVDNDGKVLIKGVTTTGEKTVRRGSLVFEMQTQNLCPPGMFSISFQLPGPIEPQQFTGNFGIDGILEGLVRKGGKTKQ